MADVKKQPFYLLRDAKGEKSVTVTITLLAFWIVSCAYIISVVETIGPLKIRPFDVAACSTFLMPCLSLYGFKKHTDSNVHIATTVANNKNVVIDTSKLQTGGE